MVKRRVSAGPFGGSSSPGGAILRDTTGKAVASALRPSSSGIISARDTRIRLEEAQKLRDKIKRATEKRRLDKLRAGQRERTEQRAKAKAEQKRLERIIRNEKIRISKIRIQSKRAEALQTLGTKLRMLKKEQKRGFGFEASALISSRQIQSMQPDSFRFEQRFVGTTISNGREIPIIENVEINERTGNERKLSFKESKRIFPEELKVPEDTGIAQVLRTKRRILRAGKERGKNGTALTNIINESKLALLTLGSIGVEGVQSIKQLPGLIKTIVKNPQIITRVPAFIKRSGANFGRILRTSPTEAIVMVAGELLLLKGTGKAFKITGKVTGIARAKIINVLRRVKLKQKSITFPSTTGGRPQRLEIVRGTADVVEPLSKQVKLAGTRITAVSAQADALLRLVRRQRIIRKPIPGEEKLSTATKNLLKGFDEGRLSKQGLTNLERRIQKETGQGGLLERSFFADPRGRIRTRRLGLEGPTIKQQIKKLKSKPNLTNKELQKLKELVEENRLINRLATFFTEDVTFIKPKPQILVFENVRVQNLPKALSKIESKLKAGKTLTSQEANQLLKFQLEPSGKFKPIGALSKESEVTLAPGEITKRIKTIGFVNVGGKRVPLVAAKVVKPTQNLKKLIKEFNSGKITNKNLKKLKKQLNKETGFKNALERRTSTSRRIPEPKRVIRLPKPVIRTRTRPGKRRKKTIRRPVIKRITRRPTPRRPLPRRLTGGVRARPRPAVRRVTIKPPIRTPPRVRPRRLSLTGKPPKIRFKKRGVFPKLSPRKGGSYNVFARPLKRTKKGKKPKQVKINLVPLSKRSAKNLRSFVVDQSLSRTGQIKVTGGKPKRPKLRIPVGYATRTKKKFRNFRVVKGKRIKLPRGKRIEKTRNIQDTKREKRKLTLLRLKANLVKASRKKPITKSHRKVLLKRLVLARKVRSRNLRKR